MRIYRYLDISMTSLGGSSSLSTQFASSSGPPFKWRRMCAFARRSNSLLWTDKYSPNQRLKDMEFCRPMELGYESVLVRFRIWNSRLNGKLNDENNITAESLLQDLLRLKEASTTSPTNRVYIDLLSNLDPRTTKKSYR